MSRENVEFYQRGKNIGVIDLETGKRHLLKTLGVLDEYKGFVERVELEQLKAQISKAQKKQLARKLKTQTQSVSDAQRSPLENEPGNVAEQKMPVSDERKQEKANQLEEHSEVERVQNERAEQMKKFRTNQSNNNAQTHKR